MTLILSSFYFMSILMTLCHIWHIYQGHENCYCVIGSFYSDTNLLQWSKILGPYELDSHALFKYCRWLIRFCVALVRLCCLESSSIPPPPTHTHTPPHTHTPSSASSPLDRQAEVLFTKASGGCDKYGAPCVKKLL